MNGQPDTDACGGNIKKGMSSHEDAEKKTPALFLKRMADLAILFRNS